MTGSNVIRVGADAQELSIRQTTERLLDCSLQGAFVTQVARAEISVENDSGWLHSLLGLDFDPGSVTELSICSRQVRSGVLAIASVARAML